MIAPKAAGPGAARPRVWIFVDLDHHYTRTIFHGLAREGWEVCATTPCRLLQTRDVRGDVLHLQWIDYLFRTSGGLSAASGAIRLLAILVALRLRGMRIVWTVHNEHNHYGRFERLEQLTQRAVIGLSDRIIVMTSTTSARMQRRFPRARAKIRLVPHPTLDPLADVMHPGLASPSSLLRIAFFGGLRRHKGLDVLAAAVERLPPDLPWSLEILGSPETPEMAALATAIAASVPESACRLREYDDLELAELVYRSHAVLLTHRTGTNSGVLLAAVTLSRPVICPRIDSFEEVLTGADDAAVLFEPGDPRSLAEAIECAVDRWRADGAASAADAVARVRRRHDARRVVDQHADVYAELSLPTTRSTEGARPAWSRCGRRGSPG